MQSNTTFNRIWTGFHKLIQSQSHINLTLIWCRIGSGLVYGTGSWSQNFDGFYILFWFPGPAEELEYPAGFRAVPLVCSFLARWRCNQAAGAVCASSAVSACHHDQNMGEVSVNKNLHQNDIILTSWRTCYQYDVVLTHTRTLHVAVDSSGLVYETGSCD